MTRFFRCPDNGGLPRVARRFPEHFRASTVSSMSLVVVLTLLAGRNAQLHRILPLCAEGRRFWVFVIVWNLYWSLRPPMKRLFQNSCDFVSRLQSFVEIVYF